MVGVTIVIASFPSNLSSGMGLRLSFFLSGTFGTPVSELNNVSTGDVTCVANKTTSTKQLRNPALSLLSGTQETAYYSKAEIIVLK